MAGDGGTGFPIYGDIRTFEASSWRGHVDIVTGGFPCQPFSFAGRRRGEDDSRNMWPPTLRVLVESGAGLALFENVPGLLSAKRDLCPDCGSGTEPVQCDHDRCYRAGDEYTGLVTAYWCESCQTLVDESAVVPDRYFGTILGQLSDAGFNAEWTVLGAEDVGAPHRRKRLWILAYTADGRERLLRDQGVGREGYDAYSGGVRVRNEPGNGGGHEGESSSPWWLDPADIPDAGSGGRVDGQVGAEHGRQDSRAEPFGVCEETGAELANTLDSVRDGRPDEPRRGEIGGAAAGWASGSGSAEPRLDGVADELACGMDQYIPRVCVDMPDRVSRLHAIGNGQVPVAMAYAFTFLAGEAGLLQRLKP